MDPTTLVAERAAAEWAMLMASLGDLTLRGALVLALLLGIAVVATALLHPSEPLGADTHDAGSDAAMCQAPSAPLRGAEAIETTTAGSTDAAPAATDRSRAGEPAAWISPHRRARPVWGRRGRPLRPRCRACRRYATWRINQPGVFTRVTVAAQARRGCRANGSGLSPA